LPALADVAVVQADRALKQFDHWGRMGEKYFISDLGPDGSPLGKDWIIEQSSADPGDGARLIVTQLITPDSDLWRDEKLVPALISNRMLPEQLILKSARRHKGEIGTIVSLTHALGGGPEMHSHVLMGLNEIESNSTFGDFRKKVNSDYRRCRRDGLLENQFDLDPQKGYGTRYERARREDYEPRKTSEAEPESLDEWIARCKLVDGPRNKHNWDDLFGLWTLRQVCMKSNLPATAAAVLEALYRTPSRSVRREWEAVGEMLGLSDAEIDSSKRTIYRWAPTLENLLDQRVETNPFGRGARDFAAAIHDLRKIRRTLKS
jgi:hypothetical protein